MSKYLASRGSGGSGDELVVVRRLLVSAVLSALVAVKKAHASLQYLLKLRAVVGGVEEHGEINPDLRECQICMTEKDPAEMRAIISCGHCCCSDCMGDFLEHMERRPRPGRRARGLLPSHVLIATSLLRPLTWCGWR